MELIEKVKNAGIVGAGGAGFPTHEKLKKPVEFLLVNAAECEPLLFSDQYVMRTSAEQIVKGIKLAAKELKVSKVYFVTKSKYKIEIEVIKKAVEKNKAKSMIEIVALDNFYPAGDEQVLVECVVGRSVPAGGIPLDVNCVVMNVTTLLQVAEAAQDKPVVRRTLTITGNVKLPTLLTVPIGISVAECLKFAGGSLSPRYHVIIGGPLMGKIIDDKDIESTYLKKTDSALIVLPYEHYLVRRKRATVQKIINEARTACIQCRMCTDMCPRYLLGHNLQPHLIMRNVGLPFAQREILEQSFYCCECGACEMWACPMGLSPRLVNISTKEKLRAEGAIPKKQTGQVQSRSFALGRRIPTERLLAKLNIMQYKKLQPMENLQKADVSRVVLAMKQHVGAPAEAIVQVGETVEVGQLVAKVRENTLSANVHASISGKVQTVTNDFVEIVGGPE